MTDVSWPSVYAVYALMAFFVSGAAWCLWWAIRNGAVRDDESPKYRMLEDDGPAVRPSPKAGSEGRKR